MAVTAKMIKEVLDIGPARYQYLQEKMNIKATVKEAEGRGRVRRFSYADVVLFSVAHAASRAAWTSKSVVRLMMALEKFDEQEGLGIFEKKKRFDKLFGYRVIFHSPAAVYYTITNQGEKFSSIAFEERKPSPDAAIEMAYKKLRPGGKNIDLWLDTADSYYCVNVGLAKNRVADIEAIG
jgi:hypothetical protein